ncbi:MAG: ATP-binding cassette domain-containing protein [Armatimonadetes bacterium]|nr:ATP-binding cassette domain-containing protein [Armatimonadota bacterium]
MLKVEDVSHAYYSDPVLTDVSFQVAPGEIIAVMGSSGGGKTTLLKCIAGLIKPTDGAITIDGIDVISQPEEARRKTGFVFQYAALFDFLNVRDNVLFGVQRLRKLSAAEKTAFVEERLAEVGLSGAEMMMPSELSGGMRKRVGLARALAMEPKLLLYDEPTSGLDPVTAYSIDQLIVETRDRIGVTSIVVSHDVTSVMRLADRIAFLEKGELVFDGSAAEFDRSQNSAIRELVDKSHAETFGAS